MEVTVVKGVKPDGAPVVVQDRHLLHSWLLSLVTSPRVGRREGREAALAPLLPASRIFAAIPIAGAWIPFQGVLGGRGGCGCSLNSPTPQGLLRVMYVVRAKKQSRVNLVSTEPITKLEAPHISGH